MKRYIITSFILFMTLFGDVAESNSGELRQGIYKYHSSEILHLDVRDEAIQNITRYINKHFNTHIILDAQIAKKQITTRCETDWYNALLQISAENDWEIVRTQQGIWLKSKNSGSYLHSTRSR